MAISGVNPKCYILALFVRDDGARFLLGDDPFEFKDNQLHFQQNTMANDVVEVQGNDGYLLAGQVRRPGTQMFDGYVCNGTNSKAEVEVKRRAFLQFFRRSHFYKVIYVFPNGTAIQRKQGFLVDDPTVQELYQQYPEYHVALNFEDVNYYTYEEDDQGHEIYAKEAIVPLARGGATGGLIWDSYGVVWEDPWSLPLSISGVQFQILNNAGARAPIDNVELYGDTYQQTYSGKNLLPSNTVGTTTSHNVTITVDETGRITVNGTADANVYFDLNKVTLTAGSYMLSGVPFNGSSSSFRIAFNFGGTIQSLFSVNGKTFTLDNTYTATEAFLFIAKNYTANNLVFEPMIESGSTKTSYEPYVGGIPAPNPDYPQDIQVVTGEQTVTIGDGVDSEDFTISLGSTELCKIDDYQDYIYKSGDDWYVHKEFVKYYLSDFTFTMESNASNYRIVCQTQLLDLQKPVSNDALPIALCSHYGTVTANDTWRSVRGICMSQSNRLYIYDNSYNQSTSASGYNSWIQDNKPSLFWKLAAPTDTKITDATLVGQLEALGAMKLFIGENNGLVSATEPNLPATLAFDYYTKFTTIGAEWEEGGTKGATIVNVDAIDNTYPVWELTGPATNPTLSVLTTNTALTYNGTITASQKLVIDMFNKTATLNGTSVIGNISGDFVYMAPGTNRLAYTAGNTDAPDSTIYWQEVVG